MILNFIIDDKKLDVDMLRLCWILLTIAVELYNSYCHCVAVMASRLNLLSSYNQENITGSGLPIVDTSSKIWICVSDQQLIKFHVVFYKYRITFLTVFQWSIPGLIKYLPSFLMIYAVWTGTNLSIHQTSNHRCIWNVFHLLFLYVILETLEWTQFIFTRAILHATSINTLSI